MDVFGSSGVRGVVNQGMTPAFATQVAQAAGTVWAADRVAIARDTRLSGQMLADAVAAGLASVGTEVERLGVVPTPAAQAHAEREGIPAVLVTASHNPPEFNGLKLVAADGGGLTVETLEAVERTLIEESFETAEWDGIGACRRRTDAAANYVDAVVEAVDAERIAAADLTVAIDPGNGAGCETSPAIFRRLGCDVHTVHAQPDGRFPGRAPEPVPAELGDLSRLVRAADADLGIAHDGDADRAVFVDERGDPIDGDASLAALASAELGQGDAMVSAVNVSQRVVDAVEAAGADLDLTPIGATYLSSRVRELQAAGQSVPIAGEGNGGVFFPPYRLARDGAYGAARFLELVAERPASEIVAPYDDYHFVQANLEYEEEADRDRMIAAATAWAKGQDGTLDTTDGYRVDYGDAWVLMRESGTEPLVRAYAEARDRDRAESLLGEAVEVLEDA
ncbi:phosphoglucosamine mutase [Salinarchaeum sp. Harcht-Bsk1]|uniref:phosphoglucosamine mutase n=1 Tax=Salinarchaeum sp. Harcht-Bsk1 TaxID=1333523 RepID=UPI0003422CE3|nr:phosphoglucosamine mutase [Salinarchaeum sp. Harcht-Bsk1]AGN01715.1 phosphoglucosamine mutase [Salinarchaeum sp. Harcht-Bsk1]